MLCERWTSSMVSAIAVAACLAPGAAAQPRGDARLYAGGDLDWSWRRGVAIYRDRGFSGRREIFFEDDPDLRNNRVGDGAASSVRVAPGCRVILFSQRDYRGRSVEIGSDVHDLGGTRLGDNAGSSLQVRCSDRWDDRRDDRWDDRRGPDAGGENPWDGRSGVGGATLYAGGDYSGRSEIFYRDVDRLSETEVGNDTVSSVRVDPGCRLVLYEHPDYRGHSVVLTGDEPDMRRTSLGNDRASSLRIDCR